MKYEVILVFLFLLSCNSNESNLKDTSAPVLREISVSTDFPEVRNLKSVPLDVKGALLKPLRIISIDSFLVVLQSRNDTLVSIFRAKDMSHVKSFGSKGEAIHDFRLTFPSTFSSYYGPSNGIGIGDKMSNVRFYKLEDVLNNDVESYKTARLPVELNGFRAVAYLGDSLIFGAPYGTDHIDLFKYSVREEQLAEVVEYPDRFPLMSNEVKREVYGCYMANKPDDTKFVRTFSNQGFIEIYDVANLSMAPISLSYEPFPSLEENLQIDESSEYMKSLDEMKIFSWEVVANNHYIYALIINSGYKNVAGSNGLEEEFIPEIHVYDWEGNPVDRYLLDHPFVNFAVDTEGKYLYTFSEFEEGIISRYELSRS